VDPELLRQAEPAPHAGKPEAAGCASGAALVAVLSKVALAGKFLLPVVSALASLAAYALLFGWQFGVGIVALLFIHEMGHYVVLRAKGIPASLPVFIPLLGAYVAMRRMPPNARDEAEVAVAGPLAGALAGACCFALFEQTRVSIFLPLAWFSFFLNLINLIPVSPLDGGRIVSAISRWFWPVGLVLVIVAFFYTGSILLLVLAWLGLMQTIQRFRVAPAMAGYYRVPLLSRAYVTTLYFGLAAALSVGMVATQDLMHQLAARPF
jgi:Zn-dependent protease